MNSNLFGSISEPFTLSWSNGQNALVFNSGLVPQLNFYNPLGVSIASYTLAGDFWTFSSKIKLANVIALSAGGQTIIDPVTGNFSPTHIVPQSIGPALAATVQAAAGAGATVTILNNPSDAGFKILLTTGTGPASGVQFSVTFGTAYAAAPKVVFCPQNQNAVVDTTKMYVDDATITGAGFNFVAAIAALGASTQFIWDFIVIQ